MENKIRYQFSRLPIVLFLACLAISVVAGDQSQENKIDHKSFKITKPLTLTCKPENVADFEKIVWSKSEKSSDDDKPDVWKNVKDVKSLRGRYQLKPKEGAFVIERTVEEDAGYYSCSVGETVKEKYNVYANLIVKIPENIYVVEEEKLEITCVVKGTNPSIEWKYRAEDSNETKTIEENDRMKFSTFGEIENSRLTIEKAVLSDRGTYTCIGTNDAGDESASSEGFLRVKDKLAALWPFLGICAEVFVLCAIILIYEKRRNKTDDADSDTDQSPDQKNDHHSDVRHRK